MVIGRWRTSGRLCMAEVGGLLAGADIEVLGPVVGGDNVVVGDDTEGGIEKEVTNDSGLAVVEEEVPEWITAGV
jgi:hypothetical protein